MGMDDAYKMINQTLVSLINEIWELEEKAIITDEFKDLTNNDMHVIEAIGMGTPKNMSSIAKELSVTVGTLTIAMNSLVKKGYVSRVRSAQDKRVVLLSLTDKGLSAYEKHAAFHQKMVSTVMEGLDGQEMEVLAHALEKLRGYFKVL